jgi:cell division protein FtsN
MDMDDSIDTRQLKLDHRHVAFFFLAAVGVCAVFFCLGFLVGRGQTYEAGVKDLSSKASELKQVGGSISEDNSAPRSSLEEGGLNAQDVARPVTSEKKKEKSNDYRGELDFYSAVKNKRVEENFQPTSKEPQKPLTPLATMKSDAPAVSPHGTAQSKPIPSRNLVSLQVAALRSSGEANKLAKTLRSKGYSVSIVSPSGRSADKLIRVNVGPFTDLGEATKVKTQLEKSGYQAILKR